MEFSLIVPILTPFNTNLEIDHQALAEHCNRLAEHVDEIFIFGTSGEWPCIGVGEKIETLERLVEKTRTDKIIVGVHSFSIKDTLTLARKCNDIGILTISSLPPLYYKPSKENILKYFDILCRSFENNIMIYIYPNVQGYDIPIDVLLKLVSEHSNIISIKITHRDFTYILNMVKQVKKVRKDVKIYVGNGYYTLLHKIVEGDGLIDTYLNIVPGLYREAVEKNSIKLYQDILKIYTINRDFSIIKFCKAVLKRRGIYKTDLTRFITSDIPSDKVQEFINMFERYLI